MSSHKILIVDDHPLFLNALSVTLETTSQDIESNAVGRFSDLTKWLSGSTSTDLVLLDLELPDVPNILGVAYLRALHPNLPVIVVSAVDDDQTIQICRCLGVCGFIPKSSVGADVRDIVELALAGEMSFPETFVRTACQRSELSRLASRVATLSPRQLEVAMLLCLGKLNKQNAYDLGVVEATIKAHVTSVMLKLELDSRTQAAIAINRLEGGNDLKEVGAKLLANSLAAQAYKANPKQFNARSSSCHAHHA